MQAICLGREMLPLYSPDTISVSIGRPEVGQGALTAQTQAPRNPEHFGLL